MPNCFQLYPKGSTEPAILQAVDEAMCQHFGVSVDPRYWFYGWYHCIGFLIAMKGYPLGSDALRAEVCKWYEDPGEAEHLALMLRILDWLAEHYTSDAWVEVGRRA